jgi:hypothetical protein
VALPIIYVVRVYRRSSWDRRSVVGVVEVVDGGMQLSFSNAAELWSLISSPPVVRAQRDSLPRRRRCIGSGNCKKR